MLSRNFLVILFRFHPFINRIMITDDSPSLRFTHDDDDDDASKVRMRGKLKEEQLFNVIER